MDYDYKEGKKRILDILNDSNTYEKVDRIPLDNEFTYDNGYYGWVSSIFIDVRESTRLFSDNKKRSTAKIIRCFISEMIEILGNDSNLREIGIRGDCVYAIYASRTNNDDTYLDKKNYYLSKNGFDHPSYNCYIESINEVYAKIVK